MQTPAVGAPLFGAPELAGLRQGARLVSPCTPGAVDGEALARALASDRLAAAAVAVEPGSVPVALLEAPHLLLTSAAEAGTADARRRAAVSVAEQVAAVLHGRLRRGAVNVPAAATDDADELMPFMGLCAQLGELLVQLAAEPIDAVEIAYGGSVAYYDTHLLTLGVLGGLLSDRSDTPVNFVNAEGVADHLGVTVSETRESGIPDFPRLISVAVAGTGGAMSVSGTSLGSEHKSRLVRVFGEDVDIEPARHMAFLRYVDAPGIGGKVGTLPGRVGRQYRPHVGRARQARRRGGHGSHAGRVADARADGRARRALRPQVRPGGGALEEPRGGGSVCFAPAASAFGGPTASGGLPHDLGDFVRVWQGCCPRCP